MLPATPPRSGAGRPPTHGHNDEHILTPRQEHRRRADASGLDKHWDSRHPQRHWPRCCDDRLNPPRRVRGRADDRALPEPRETCTGVDQYSWEKGTLGVAGHRSATDEKSGVRTRTPSASCTASGACHRGTVVETFTERVFWDTADSGTHADLNRSQRTFRGSPFRLRVTGLH